MTRKIIDITDCYDIWKWAMIENKVNYIELKWYGGIVKQYEYNNNIYREYRWESNKLHCLTREKVGK